MSDNAKKFQQAINLAFRQAGVAKSIAVDGVIGQKTISAFSLMPSQTLRHLDLSLRIDRNPVKKEDVSASSPWISLESLASIISDAAALYALPESYAYLLLGLEPETRVSGAGTLVNVRSTRGTYHGLGQFDKASWSDARRWATRLGDTYLSRTSFDQGRYDPKASVRAMYAYARMNSYILKRNGVPLPHSDDLLYLAHNQGAGATVLALKTKDLPAYFAGQSEKAKAVIKEALVSYT